MYVSRFSEMFEKHLEKLTKRDIILKKRVMDKIGEMENDPFRNSIELGYELKGKRRIRIGDYRLIYAICVDCRKKGYTKFNQCHDCESNDDNTIVFFDIIHRSKGYDYL